MISCFNERNHVSLFLRGEPFSMTYNVQPLRTQQEINDFLFCLLRNKNANRDVFLFLIGINSGLRMSDIVKLKKKDVISSKNPRIVEKKNGENTHFIFK